MAIDAKGIVVLCVGADGLRGDPLIKESALGEGWSLTPEGLAECVRIVALECAGGEIIEDVEDTTVAPEGTPNNANDDQKTASTRRKRKRKRRGRGGRRGG